MMKLFVLLSLVAAAVTSSPTYGERRLVLRRPDLSSLPQLFNVDAEGKKLLSVLLADARNMELFASLKDHGDRITSATRTSTRNVPVGSVTDTFAVTVRRIMGTREVGGASMAIRRITLRGVVEYERDDLQIVR